MIDLNKLTSMHLIFDEKTNNLIYGPASNPKTVTPLLKIADDLKDVLIDHQWFAHADKEDKIYLIFRDICNHMDKPKLEKLDLRFDILVILPKMLGKEYPKLTGLETPTAELHQILEGEAMFLMQKTEGNRIVDAYFVKPKKGEIVLVPAKYSRTAINTGKTPAIICSWVSRSSLRKEEPILEKRGMCQYVVEGKMVANENYSEVPSELPVKEASKAEELGLKAQMPLYRMVDKLDSLKKIIVG